MRQFKHCILFLVDGARPDVVEQLLSSGKLPNIQRFILEKGSYKKVITSFPSTTGPAYIPFIMGCYPGTANIPGIRWFDKEEYAKKNSITKRFRSYMGWEALLFNKDLPDGKKTLFEIFKSSVNIFNPLTRGIKPGGNLTRFSKTLYYSYAHLTYRWQVPDLAAKRYLNKAIKICPEFIFVVFPAVDSFSHFNHPFSQKVMRSYRNVDQALGEVAKLLEKKGVLDQTLLIITSDHGLTSTKSHLDLVGFLDENGYRALHYPKIFRPGVRSAVMVSGNSMANLYFRGEKSWEGPIFFEEFEKKHLFLLRKIIRRKEIDILAIREKDGGIRIISKNGMSKIKKEGDLISYDLIEGDDPFGYEKLPEKLSDYQSLELTFDSLYPDAPVQLLQIFSSKRCGDIVLSAKKGYDLRKRFEWPEHKASHGSLFKEHMLVPLLINQKIQDKKIRTVDIFPSILKLMGKACDNEIDGKSFV